MPNRIIKESTFTSEKIAELSDFEFRLWIGLITQADDAGRGDARPAIIKGRVFALRNRVTIKEIDNALRALAAYSCICLYTVDGRPYYEFPNWAAHQRIRNVKPRFPGKNAKHDDQRTAADCGELPQPAADCGPIQYNPIRIQSESESESESNTKDMRLRARFVSPSVDEVGAYCRERDNGIDAQAFVDFYESKGWRVGSSPMKDWKAAVRTWEKRQKEGNGEKGWDFNDFRRNG